MTFGIVVFPCRGNDKCRTIRQIESWASEHMRFCLSRFAPLASIHPPVDFRRAQVILGKLRYFYQKTREGCGCFRGLCRSSAGKFRENSGKIAGKFFPNREMLQILGFRAPGRANLPETLGPHCRDLVPTFRAGCFLKSTVPAFSSFSDFRQI